MSKNPVANIVAIIGLSWIVLSLLAQVSVAATLGFVVIGAFLAVLSWQPWNKA